MSVIGAQLERVTARPLNMLLARTVALGRLSALIPPEALALRPKPTESAGWSKIRFNV